MSEKAQSHTKGNLFIVSAPSGAGKTSLLKALVAKLDGLEIATSTTTRPIRPGEVDGKDYHFANIDEFEQLIQQGQFLEYAKVFDNYYGTSKTTVEQALNEGQDLVLEIDWQGARQIREQLPDAISIFILPPSKQELEKRLTGRGQDPAEVIARRMASALEEISHYDEYQYLIINDLFEQALTELEQIVRACRQTLAYQQASQADLLKSLTQSS
jgi:guanylate kinase